MSKKTTATAIIKALKAKYKDDPEAMEEIERREKDIEYIEKKEAAGNYSGQPSIGMAKMLEADLEYWN